MKTYDVNLRDQPENRWDKVIDDNIVILKNMNVKINKEIRDKLGFINAYIIFPIFFSLVLALYFLLDREYFREMQGISKKSGISLRKILQLNLGYDFLAKCTSIVVYDKEANKVWHLRNMDWDTDILNDITINVKFYDDDKLLYECVTWIGFVGIMTGCSHQNDSSMISLNFRKENNNILRNIYRYVTMYRPTSFAIRKFLQTENPNFLSSTIAPCYLTIGTKDKIQICEFGNNNNNIDYIIDNNHHDVTNNNLNYLIKTNNDFNMTSIDKKWADGDFLLLNTLERKETAENELKKYSNEKLDFITCFKIMETSPVKNIQTVYTTVMCLDINTNKITLESKVYNQST